MKNEQLLQFLETFLRDAEESSVTARVRKSVSHLSPEESRMVEEFLLSLVSGNFDLNWESAFPLPQTAFELIRQGYLSSGYLDKPFSVTRDYYRNLILLPHREIFQENMLLTMSTAGVFGALVFLSHDHPAAEYRALSAGAVREMETGGPLAPYFRRNSHLLGNTFADRWEEFEKTGNEAVLKL